MLLMLLFAVAAMASGSQADAAPLLKPAQIHNLRLLVREGRAEHRPQLLAISAIDTAYAETLLTNKDIRDRDGRPLFSGVFGLIPGAWGLYPAQQRMPMIAARSYYARAGVFHRRHPGYRAGKLAQLVMAEPWTQAYITFESLARTLYLRYGTHP